MSFCGNSTISNDQFEPAKRRVLEGPHDGVPPIELVDGSALIGSALIVLMRQLQLGLQEQTTWIVDHRFFDQFCD